jgi:DNA-binding beta-propeller fold protein YncE
VRRTLWLVLLGISSLTHINCGPKSSPAAPSGGSSYSFITNLGQSGDPTTPYSFNEILGIAVSGDKMFVGSIYSFPQSPIQVYDLSGNYLTYFWPLDSYSQPIVPLNMTSDKFGHLYIADPSDDEVDVINVNSIPLTTVNNDVYATQTYAAPCPVGIAVDPTGIIYVADLCDGEAYSMVQEGLNPGSGYFTYSGSPDINSGDLSAPQGVAVSPDGSKVYVADTDNNVIQVYDSGFNWLSVIGDAAGAPGTMAGKFDNPVGLAVDNSGSLFVVDADNARIQKFDSKGNFRISIGDTASNISNGELSSPAALALDANNNVFVTDTNYDTVFEFAPN